MKEIKVNDKTVGYIVNGVYITRRDKSRHYFYKFEGWGLSESVIEQLVKLGIRRVIIREQVDHLYELGDFLNGTVWVQGDDKQYIATKPKKKEWSQGF